MKIKTDFITNSSSTSYVICLPDNWYPSDEVIKEAVKWLAEPDSEVTIPAGHKDKIMKFFDDLRRGQILCMEDIEIDFYYILCNCLNDDHIILSFETGSGGGFVEHIYKEKLVKVLSSVYSGKSFKENISATVLGGQK